MGTLCPSNAMFLRIFCGECKDKDGNEYELATHAGNGAPLIRSKQTGRTYAFDWKELVEEAVAGGIDTDDKEQTA